MSRTITLPVFTLVVGLSATHANADTFPVQLRVDATQPIGAMTPIWRFFGADEPNYGAMHDGRKLLGDMGALRPDQVYFRAHNLLCTGDGTPALKWGSTNIYTEDAAGNPVYDWTIVDRIFDAYRENQVRPLVQLGFMPQALSTHPEPYQHTWRPGLRYREIVTGWAYPPKDYDKWRELMTQWVKHCISRYGKAEVETWYWEVWNEADGDYWQASNEEFLKLHDYAIDGVRRALPIAKVGGPHAAGGSGSFMRTFLEHCFRGVNAATGKQGTPLDYIGFHAKGAPTFVDGHVRMGIANQLRAIDNSFALIKSFPEAAGLPIIIGESDPDGCAACQGPQLGYRNTTMYASYTAASFARKYQLADRHGVPLAGALTWAFEFEDQPYFAGFRVMASNGLTLPVFNVFRMFSKMGGERLKCRSTSAVSLDAIMQRGVRNDPDVAALASLDQQRLCVLVWHYHDDDVLGPTANVDLQIIGIPVGVSQARFTHYRIDNEHSNAFTAWRQLGSPQSPTADQYALLEQASELAVMESSPAFEIQQGMCRLAFELPRQAVSLVMLEW